MSKSRGWRIERKLVAIVPLCVGIGYLILIAVQIHDFHQQSYKSALTGNRHLTQLIAAQMAGGVRWRKPGAIERA